MSTVSGCFSDKILITSATKFMFSSEFFYSFVGLLAALRKKTAKPIFTKFGGNVAHEPQEKND